MAKRLDARVAALEKRTGRGDLGPTYVTLETLDSPLPPGIRGPVKVYVGVSPDDWPGPEESGLMARSNIYTHT